MDRSLEDLLSATPLVVRRGPYALASWTPAQESAVFASVLRSHTDVSYTVTDDREVTACVLETSLDDLPPPRHVERGWSILTLDAEMAWDVVGVLARVSHELAEAGLSVGAVAAYARDHFLVKYADLEAALDALKGVCGPVRFEE